MKMMLVMGHPKVGLTEFGDASWLQCTAHTNLLLCFVVASAADVSRAGFMDMLRQNEAQTSSAAAAASSSAGSGSKPAVRTSIRCNGINSPIHSLNPTSMSTSPCQPTQWSVLRDDFMMGASLKDWGRVEHERKHGAGTSVGGLAAVVAQETTGQDEGWNAGGLDALGSDSD